MYQLYFFYLQKKYLLFMNTFVTITKVQARTQTKNTIWFVGQAAKTSPSHGENRGSIPLRTALKALKTLFLELFVIKKLSPFLRRQFFIFLLLSFYYIFIKQHYNCRQHKYNHNHCADSSIGNHHTGGRYYLLCHKKRY